jgi:hypothetical protein
MRVDFFFLRPEPVFYGLLRQSEKNLVRVDATAPHGPRIIRDHDYATHHHTRRAEQRLETLAGSFAS